MRQLILEITESQIMSDLDAAVARLHELKALGAHLALDDFGTGYSSLAYLRSFPIDVVKIDRAFIGDVADPSSDDHALVRAIISLGQALDIRVVAEGIEEEDQRRELRRLGCDRGQDYLFSRPLPCTELILAAGAAPPCAARPRSPAARPPRRPPRREDRRATPTTIAKISSETICPIGSQKVVPSLSSAWITADPKKIPEHEPEQRAEHGGDPLS